MKRIVLAVATATSIPTAASANSHFDALQGLPFDIIGGCAIGAIAGWLIFNEKPTLAAILGGIVGALIGGAFGP